jgi:hypothetical protein
MRDTDIDYQEPLFVSDHSDGQHRTGLADLRHASLSVTLHAFDEAIVIDDSREAVFTTEKGEILTLHHFFANGGGWREGSGATVWNDTLQANQIVLGPDEWKLDDRLKRCTFKVEGTSDLLHNMERFEAIEAADSGAMPSLDVFTIDDGGARVTLTHDVRGGGFNGGRRASSPSS